MSADDNKSMENYPACSGLRTPHRFPGKSQTNHSKTIIMTASIADADKMKGSEPSSDFIWDFEKLPYPELHEKWENKC